MAAVHPPAPTATPPPHLFAQKRRVQVRDPSTDEAADAALILYLRQHGLGAQQASAIGLAAGAETLEDLRALDPDGCAEVVRRARLTPVAASKLRQALLEGGHTPQCAVPADLASEVAASVMPTVAQIQAQLAKGGVVRLPAGVIEIDRPLLLGVSGTVLEGVGPGATILRLKKSGEAIQLLSLLYGACSGKY